MCPAARLGARKVAKERQRESDDRVVGRRRYKRSQPGTGAMWAEDRGGEASGKEKRVKCVSDRELGARMATCRA